MTSRHLVSLLVIGIAAGVFTRPVAGQHTPASRHSTLATRSVLKPADQVEWADYHAGVVAGPGISGCTAAHVGCSDGVCYGYDNCCCRPHLLGCLRKFVRMLDCLVPCHSGNGGCCLFGGCRPHLFAGGRCGCGDVSCTSSCPSCTTPVGSHSLSDPFIDDPEPPKPLPDSSTSMRQRPARASVATVAASSASPYKVTTTRELLRQHVEATSRRDTAPAHTAARPEPVANPRDRVTARPPTHSRPAPKSPLQRASAEEEVPVSGQLKEWLTPPALLPVTIHRTESESSTDDTAIPVNPLRK